MNYFSYNSRLQIHNQIQNIIPWWWNVMFRLLKWTQNDILYPKLFLMTDAEFPKHLRGEENICIKKNMLPRTPWLFFVTSIACGYKWWETYNSTPVFAPRQPIIQLILSNHHWLRMNATDHFHKCFSWDARVQTFHAANPRSQRVGGTISSGS